MITQQKKKMMQNVDQEKEFSTEQISPLSNS